MSGYGGKRLNRHRKIIFFRFPVTIYSVIRLIQCVGKSAYYVPCIRLQAKTEDIRREDRIVPDRYSLTG